MNDHERLKLARPDGDADFKRLGPDVCICRTCGTRVSWNALARSGHLRRSRTHGAAVQKARGA